MFGGYLALQRMQQDAAKMMNRLRLAYTALQKLEPENHLLKLLKLKEAPEIPSPEPELCPVNVSYSFTHDFVRKYKPAQPTETENIFVEFREGLEAYVVDLEAELQKK